MARLEKYLKNVKILAFKPSKQPNDWSCGIYSLHMICNYAGKNVSPNKIIDACLKFVPNNDFESLKDTGAPIEGLKYASSLLGLSYTEGRFTIEKLKSFIDKGWPTLVMVQAWGDGSIRNWENEMDRGHYIVCIGYNDEENTLFFADPTSYMKVWIDANAFKSRWHGVADDGVTRINNWGIVYKLRGKYSSKEDEFLEELL